MRSFWRKIVTILLASSLQIANAEVPSEVAMMRGDRFSLAPKKSIPVASLGINAFVNDARFGSIRRQLREVKSTLRLKEVRVLFRWNDNVQPTPQSLPNFSFYDDIVRSIPAGMRVIVVLTGVPSWMNNERNWVSNNPRATFVEKWVKPVVTRYRSRRSIQGWQVWNEPNAESDPENVLLDLPVDPAEYMELLGFAYQTIKSIAPQDLVISAATTAINQNFPDSFNYNRELRELGLESVSDITAIHYYGSQYENVVFLGIGDFLKSSTHSVWVTESGARGVAKQKEYGERTWQFLLDTSKNVKRIYIYQFTDSTEANTTWGLKNLTPGSTVSDLYIYLRDRSN